MFPLDRDQPHLMPAHFGPRPTPPGASGWYRDVTAMTVSYRTDRDQLARYLPPPFAVAEEPMVTVFYARNRDVDWLAGHGYNMISVSGSAVFNGENDKLTGQYSLAIWENLTDPILTGRELQGIPKVYADIADHEVIDDEWRVGASHFGHRIVDLRITDPQLLTPEELAAGKMDQVEQSPMAWRFFPSVGGLGEAVNEPTTYPSSNEVTSVRVGAGTVDWHVLTWEQNPTQFHIVNALADLPILEYGPALITEGSTNLLVPGRFPRAIS